MKKIAMKAIATMAEKSIIKANKTACWFLSYQPKAPKNIKNFKK